jgi:PIN domain nuclease of toxin-antitoxin system
MKTVLADTHSVLWHLAEPHRLSGPADAALNAAIAAGDYILVSMISLVECRYLVEKGRVTNQALDHFVAMIKDPIGHRRRQAPLRPDQDHLVTRRETTHGRDHP